MNHIPDDYSRWIGAILGSEIGFRATGLRYSLEDVDALARLIEEKVRSFRGFGECSVVQSRVVAAGILIQHIESQMIDRGIRATRNSLADINVARELRRLTRVNKPQAAALDVSYHTDLLLSDALKREKSLELLESWSNRGAISSSTDHTELIRAVAPYARLALRQNKATGGRRPDHHLETYVAGVAGLIRAVLGIRPNGNPRSQGRQLIGVAARFCGIRRENIVDPNVRSQICEKAVKKLGSGTLQFRVISVANKGACSAADE